MTKFKVDLVYSFIVDKVGIEDALMEAYSKFIDKFDLRNQSIAADKIVVEDIG